MAKKTYPKGMYANRNEKAPSFVRSSVKMDVQKAIEWLQTQPTRFVHLQILESREADEYGNTDYICIDDYKMEKEAQKAQEGINTARNVAENKEPALDDIPF